MRQKWNRYFGVVIAAWLVTMGVVSVAPGFAVVPKQDDPLQEQEFRHSDLWFENVFRPVAELPAGTARQLGSDLSQLRVDPGHAFFDLRTGRWGTLIMVEPTIPGTGVGNDLQWSSLGYEAPPQGEALEQAVWDAFRGYLTEHAAALRIDPQELAEPTVTVIGDRLIQIHAGRTIDGVPVRDTFVKAALNSGNLVLYGERNWAPVEVSTTPGLSAAEAENVVRGHVESFPFASLREEPRLELIPMSSQPEEAATFLGAGLEYRLAWVLTPDFEDHIGSWEALVDAHSGELLSFVDTNHYASRRVEGWVYPVSNDGNPPDGVMQPGFPMPFADIALDGTDVGFGTTGGNAPTGSDAGTMSTALSGRYIRMNDQCGTIDESAAAGDLDLEGVPFPGTDCEVPPGHSPGDTNASRTGFYELNRLAEQARGYLPDNVWLDQQLTAVMNIPQVCNANWNGSTVNFFRSAVAQGCRNTGEIAGVFDHEWGHGMDDNDGNPNVSNPGEGIADIFAHNRLNTSCIGRGFFIDSQCNGYGDPCLDCTGIRDIDWEKRVSGQPHDIDWIDANCGGGPAPCGGIVHCEGAVYSEAEYDLVHRDLQGFEGSPFNLDPNTALELGTRLTFYGSSNVGNWYQCTNDGTGGCNADGGYLGYLAADDDNGDLTDGTPHMSAIFAAFDRHQISCNVPAVQDSGCAGGPTDAPANVTGDTFDEGVQLTWDAVTGAEEYWIFRTEGVHGCDFGKALVGKTTDTTFSETGLRNGFEVFYSVVAAGATDACTSPMSECLSVIPTAGPSGFIEGTVTDADTLEPIENAAVEAVGPVTVGDATDENGFYRILVPEGTYDVTADHDDYDPETVPGVVVTEGGTEVVDFELTLTPVPIADISPDSFTFEVPAGGSDSDTLNMGNIGALDLEWSIVEDDVPAPLGRPVMLEEWSDDFDSYATGSQIHGQGGWKGWFNDPAAGALVSDVQAQSTPNSVEIVGASDVVREYVDSTSGQWVYTAWQFIPADFTGLSYFIMLNSYDDSGSGLNWSVQVSFDGATDTVLNEGGTGGSMPLIRDQWVEIRLEIDLDADTQDFFYNDTLLYSGSWTNEVSGGGQVNIGAVDLFANGASEVYYDDLSLVDATVPPACVDSTDVPWLSVDPESGVTPPDSTVPVDVTVDTTGLAPGEYNANLCVATNDPTAEQVQVPVALTVIDGDVPLIDVDPESLDSTLPAGGSETQPLTVANVGGGTLDWEVTEDASMTTGMRRPVSSASGSFGTRSGGASAAARDAFATERRAGASGAAADLASGLGSPLPSLRMASSSLGGVDCDAEPGIVIHDDGTLENGYSGNPLAGVTEVRFVDKFTPAAYPATYSAVCLGFITGTGPTSYDVEVVVFDDDGTGGQPGTELGSMSATVTVTQIAVPIPPGTMVVWNSVDISSLGLDVSEGSVYIGARWAPVGSGLSNVFVAGDESTDRPVGFAEGFWWNNNANAWASIESGFPNYRSLMVRAVEGGGGSPVDCTLPSWVSVDPTSGSLPGGESQVADVTFDATGLAPGDYSANLCLASNDPATPLVEVPLSLTVTDVGGPPVADITPDSFAFEVAQGGGDSETLNVGNVGGEDLIWTIDEAAPIVVPEGAPYRYGLAGAQEFHAPMGASRAAGISRGRGEAPADRVVLPAPQEMAVGSFTEGFDDITTLPGAGWAMINNSEPVGPSSWFQGNDSIFPSHEGAPNAYIAANYESAADGGDVSNWLLTPEVAIVNGTTACFWTRTSEQFEEFYDRLEVRMSIEGDSIDVGDTAESVGDFTDLLLSINPDLEEGEYPEDWTELCVTVRERSREPVTGRFAFRYWVTDTSVNGDYIGIDTASVTQPDGPPPPGCNSPTDIPWLAADPTSGTTAPGDSVPVDVAVDTAGLDVGDYSALLCVSTNDPDAPLVEVPVSLTVTEGGEDPVIDVDPESLSSSLPPDGTETQPLTIANVGAGTLDWEVTEDDGGFAGRTSAASGSDARLLPRGALTEAEKLGLTEVRRSLAERRGADTASDLASGLGSPLPSLRMASSSLGGVDCDAEPGIVIHDDGTLENGYSGNPLAGVTEVRFVDKFTPVAYPATYSAVCLGFITGTGPTSYDVEVVVFDDDGTGGQPGTELGSMSATVTVTQIAVPIPPGTMVVWNSVDISSLGLDVSEGSVYIGARWAPIGSGLSNVFVAGDESTDRPVGFAEGFWWNNNANAWASIESGFPNYRSLMVRAVEGGGPGGDCTLPSWVSVDPTSGSVPAGDSQVADVTFDATGLAPGDYSANLCLASNDPATPLVEVPLSLTVTGGGGPVADITPGSFSFEVPEGGSDDDTLNVGNTGGADLTWSLEEAEGLSVASLVEVVEDGGFEAGSPSPVWEEGSTNFGTPLCTIALCGQGGGTGPHGGDWWVWFGGINADETGFVAQEVTIPASDSAELRFWLEIPVADNPGFLDVSLGGDVLFSVTEADTGDYTTYAEVILDVSTYADGGTYELRFESTTQPGDNVTNFFVDDVSLMTDGGGGGGCDSPTDVPWLSADPTSGTTAPGGSEPVAVAVDTTGLEAGDYAAQLCVTTNDPAALLVPVPVSLTVTGGGGVTEPLDIGAFDVVSPANGGEPVVITVPGGLVNPGDVTGFDFIGTASGISGNNGWASDTCMIVEAPDGTTFSVGGISGTDPNCTVNDWDFQGGGSTEDGTYESTHEDVFPGVGDAGDWTFTFINDWDSTDAPTISWTDVTVTLHKVAPAIEGATTTRE